MRIARMRRRGLPVWPALFGLLLGLCMVAGCLTSKQAQTQTVDESRPKVRVRILSGETIVTIGGSRANKTYSPSDCNPRVILQPVGSSGISVNGKLYRGSITLMESAGKIDVINTIDIEDYLKGVVPSEVFASWPYETLRAQAIVARTYALYEAKTSTRKDFDLLPDERSQVYGGMSVEQVSSSRAVESTTGLVAAYGKPAREKIFPTYFSSTCGGAGQNAVDAFGTKNPVNALACLNTPRNTGNNCQDSPKFSWPDLVIKKDELARRLRAWATKENHELIQLATLSSIEITAMNRANRPAQFEVVESSGRRYRLKSEQMRQAINTDRGNAPILLSSFFIPMDAGDSIRFTNGRGWGHGVGMCQFCAAAWGKKGIRAEEIVKRSYPGAVVIRAY